MPEACRGSLKDSLLLAVELGNDTSWWWSMKEAWHLKAGFEAFGGRICGLTAAREAPQLRELCWDCSERGHFTP